jgi:hypothetical protein
MKDNRKKWDPPRLIVLGRGTPEENVLAGCKISKTGIKGPSTNVTGCYKGPGGNCRSECKLIAAS